MDLDKLKFPGFPEPQQTWNFPNCINGWVGRLTGAEFKVLWYILRHTYGWQKEEDSISIIQFCKGIKKRDGGWLDKGTGLNKETVTLALRSLRTKGFIRVFRGKDAKGKFLVTRYKVKRKS